MRRRGYAHEIPEVWPGVCGVAAPVRNHNGEVIAALSSERFRDGQTDLLSCVLLSAAEISGGIGYGGRWGLEAKGEAGALRSLSPLRPPVLLPGCSYCRVPTMKMFGQGT